jgi:hypothetical protein
MWPMNARKIAAEFAAYTWYEETRAGQQSRKESRQFARDHWTAFLPVAHEGLGKLLIRLASQKAKRQRKREQGRNLVLA